jgi:amino acid transporter
MAQSNVARSMTGLARMGWQRGYLVAEKSGPAAAAPAGLRRSVGLVSLMFISLGSIIGSGWLLGALTAAKAAGGASIVSWILAGVIIILLALVHAELGAAYPLAGGTARWPRIAFGSIAGFTAGWVAWLQAVTIAPIEVEAALSYLDHIWPGLVDDSGALVGRGLVVAVILMLVFTLINIAGVNWLAESNKATVIWKLAVPVLTIIVLIAVSFHASNFTAGGGFAPFGAHGIFAALPLGVVFALQGFEQAVQMGGEAKNPQKDMPRAVIGAVLIGTLIYILLEVAFIGALDSKNLLGGWANPIGEGDFGPYATIATSLGLGWLAVTLYIDAFVSPAGTGLIYVGTSARLSYALGHAGFVPKGVSKISSRGVPWTSVILAFVVGLICFLPFPSWQGLVGLVTSATVIMYGFAPITLVALRKVDPDRTRPYRLPAATPVSVLAFVAANLIIYWTGWSVDWKLFVGILVGFVIFGLSYAFKHPLEKPPLDTAALGWMIPWFIGLAIISLMGQYGDGLGILPEWIDMLVVAIFSVAIFFLGVRLTLPEARVQEAIRSEEAEVSADPILAEG